MTTTLEFGTTRSARACSKNVSVIVRWLVLDNDTKSSQSFSLLGTGLWHLACSTQHMHLHTHFFTHKPFPPFKPSSMSYRVTSCSSCKYITPFGVPFFNPPSYININTPTPAFLDIISFSFFLSSYDDHRKYQTIQMGQNIYTSYKRSYTKETQATDQQEDCHHHNTT